MLTSKKYFLMVYFLRLKKKLSIATTKSFKLNTKNFFICDLNELNNKNFINF